MEDHFLSTCFYIGKKHSLILNSESMIFVSYHRSKQKYTVLEDKSKCCENYLGKERFGEN